MNVLKTTERNVPFDNDNFFVYHLKKKWSMNNESP